MQQTPFGSRASHSRSPNTEAISPCRLSSGSSKSGTAHAVDATLSVPASATSTKALSPYGIGTKVRSVREKLDGGVPAAWLPWWTMYLPSNMESTPSLADFGPKILECLIHYGHECLLYYVSPAAY